MKMILKAVLKAVGASKLLLLTWELVLPELQKLAEKSETKLDDRALMVLDQVIKEALGAKEVQAYLADSKLHSGEKSSLVA